MAAQIRVHHFDRCGSRQHGVPRLPNSCHPAAADFARQSVRANQRAWTERGCCFRCHAGRYCTNLTKKIAWEIKEVDIGSVATAHAAGALARGVLITAATMLGTAAARCETRQERTLPPGSMVSAYSIQRLLGTGGMGSVYRARHVLEGKVAAVKVLREDQLHYDRAIDRMMREASILATVSHGGIPLLYECGLLADGRPWIAMELVRGMPLAMRMAGGVLEPDAVAELLANVAAVLAAAHDAGVVHRDLKPDNIFLTPNDASYPVRVIDWGIAHHQTSARFTHHDEAIGTPTYMAPEQARGGPTEGCCDIYGLGVVAYQALSGRPPFVGASSVDILVQHLNRPVPALAPRCPHAPLALVELVERMLEKPLEGRPTATEVVAIARSLRDEWSAPAYTALVANSTQPTPKLDPDTVVR
jgi:serine/threonine protein kinase